MAEASEAEQPLQHDELHGVGFTEITSSDQDGETTDSDLGEFGIRQSLPVAPGDPDFDAEALTAEEYLRRVRWEAQQLPNVFISEVNPRSFDDARSQYVPAPLEAQQGALPQAEWLQHFLREFAFLRSTLHGMLPEQMPAFHEVPGNGDESGWKRYCLGSSQLSGRLPSLDLMMASDQVQVKELLQWHSNWAVAAEDIPEQTAAWLFALTAVVEKPLDADTAACMSDLLKLGWQVAAESSERRASVDIVLAICGGYFAQDDRLIAYSREEYT